MKTKTKNDNVKETDELDELFDQIEQGEEEKTKQFSAGSSDFLKLVKGQTVRGVLLPYKKNPKNTFVTYEKIGFFNRDLNTYVDLGLFPKSKGVRNDPVSKIQWNIFDNARKTGNEEAKKESYKLLPQREELVNFLILEDSANEENVGTVKVLKYSARMNKDQEPISAIHSKIKDGVFGSKKEKIGNKAFLFAKSSIIRPLVIKTKDKGGYNNYDDTSFDDAEEHEYTPEEIAAIHDACFDLEQFVPELKSNEELQSLMDQYWYQTDATKADEEDIEEDIEDDIDTTPVKKTKVALKTTISEKTKVKEETKSKPKDQIDEMIDSFDDDDLDLDMDAD